jgi:hypothetical protein
MVLVAKKYHETGIFDEMRLLMVLEGEGCFYH